MPVRKQPRQQLYTIGIDPGKSNGGIVVRAPHDRLGSEVEMYKMGNLSDQQLLAIFQKLAGRAVVYLEKVWARPGNGIKQSYAYGYGFGSIRMAAIACNVRLELVLPSHWQQAVGIKKSPKGTSYDARKKKNRERTEELFSGLKITNWNAEALLIAEYGWNILNK